MLFAVLERAQKGDSGQVAEPHLLADSCWRHCSILASRMHARGWLARDQIFSGSSTFLHWEPAVMLCKYRSLICSAFMLLTSIALGHGLIEYA